MVGLSLILESNNNKSSQVISKASLLKTNNSLLLQTPSFRLLHFCYLCKLKLLPQNDIYMYKGDRGFCSVECRCRQILMDDDDDEEEEESLTKNRCYKTPSFSTSGSSSSSMAGSGNGKSTRNRRGREWNYGISLV